MEVHSPSATVPLPDQLQKAIEDGQNRVTLLNADVDRLSRLKGTLESDIRKLNTEHDVTKTSLQLTSDQLTRATTDHEDTITKLSTAKADLVDVQGKAAEHNDRMTEAHVGLNKRESDLAAREAILNDRESKLNDREQEQSGRIASFEERRGKLKEAIAASEL